MNDYSIIYRSPYCEQFLTESLWPAYQDLGTNVMNITVIPFGNARIDETHETVTCQHGGGECDANLYELCAIAMVHQHVEDYLPFLVCNAQSLPAGFHTGPFAPEIFHACAMEAGLWWEALQACHDTPSLAWQVTLQAARATPAHKYVPYVLLNGDLLPDGVDFQTQVCKLYQQAGGHDPKCDEVLKSPGMVPFALHQACLRDDYDDDNAGAIPSAFVE